MAWLIMSTGRMLSRTTSYAPGRIGYGWPERLLVESVSMTSVSRTESTTKPWDCIVVGAGAAGLSAGLTLARARRTTLIIDSGRQSNLVAAGIGGLLGHDRRPPEEFYAAGRHDVTAYPDVELRQAEVTQGAREDDGSFTVTLTDGRHERTGHLVLTPGMDYRYPRLPGMEQRWGRSVFHCPFCHGWEVQDRPLGVLASGAVGVHGALNLRAWTDRITLLTNGNTALTEQQREQLATGGVGLDERPIAGLDGPDTELRAVTFAEGADLALDAVLVKSTIYQRSSLARDLGATVIEPDEMLSVEAIQVDAMQRTGVPGLYAAGDAATSVPPSMAAAMASGYLAGASAVVALAAGY
jgi:thioredoxin reductase